MSTVDTVCRVPRASEMMLGKLLPPRMGAIVKMGTVAVSTSASRRASLPARPIARLMRAPRAVVSLAKAVSWWRDSADQSRKGPRLRAAPRCTAPLMVMVNAVVSSAPALDEAVVP